MRPLLITLFILGFLWAYLCLGLLGIPIMLLAELLTNEYQIPNDQFILFAPICLLIFINTVAGYWIWIQWVKFARKREFNRTGKSTFWKYCAMHHFAWIILVPFFFNSLNVGIEDSATRLLYWPGGLGCWPFLIWPTIIGSMSIWLSLKAKQRLID